MPLLAAVRGLELRLGPTDGELRDVLVNGRQLRAQDGTVLGAVIAATDVSIARRAIRELDEERRSLAEAKRIGRLGSFSYDVATGTFAPSLHLRALWGLPPDGPVEDLARRATHPADAPRTAAAFATALAEGGRHVWSFRMHRPSDGKLRHLSCTVEVVHDGIGRPVKVTGTHQDVTDLVEAEQRAVRANELFEAILSATPDYTFVTQLATGAVPPTTLVIEVTETGVMKDLEACVRTLDALRAAGVRVALDDFGTGWSSLSYLKRLPANILKLDRSFVARLHEDTEDVAIAASVISLAHATGMSVVAEGVETTAQLAVLRQLRCTAGQGYLWHRGVPAPEVAQAIRRTEHVASSVS